MRGTDPGFAAFASGDLRPSSASVLRNTGNQNPASPRSFPFPNPLALPLFHPPLHEALLPNGETARPPDGATDIGAFEYTGGSVLPRGSAITAGMKLRVRSMSWKSNTVRLVFELTDPSMVRIKLTDIQGRTIATMNDGFNAAGLHTVTWGQGTSRSPLAGTRLLLLSIQAGNEMKTLKLAPNQ
jgi:hypothetical protein